jgi:hypothetical protein
LWFGVGWPLLLQSAPEVVLRVPLGRSQLWKPDDKHDNLNDMTNLSHDLGWCARWLLAALVSSLICSGAKAGVTVLGVQYQPDQIFSEYDCLWHDSNYPTSCQTNGQGANVHVYLKNTGASPVTINDVTLAGYSLKTIIDMSTNAWNPDQQYSIYFYWDNPPQDILDAGEPVWYRFDPPIIPPGGVAQVTVRLRFIPTTPVVAVGVVTSVGTNTTNITVDADAPQLAGIGYSEDLKQVYLHWRRSNGTVPTTLKLDGNDVTASATTVGDPTVNFGASVVSLTNALSFFSYHVFQGVYVDGKTATASQRAWTNKFIYATYGTFATNANYAEVDWIDEASDHGFNNVQATLGAMGGYLNTPSGAADAKAHGYGYTIMDPTKLSSYFDPDMWFLNDEPDAEEYNQSNTHCGTGLRIPCGGGHSAGTLVIKAVAHGEELRTERPLVPTTVNLDGALKPESYCTWGQAVDVLQFDNYYQRRLSDSYWTFPQRIPLYRKATYIYAHARLGCAAAEPNPSNQLLYSVEYKDSTTGQIWPFPTPESKRIEVYYSLAGGSKGLGYWWFQKGYPSNGLDTNSPAARALWKEIGLLGNEIKTVQPLLVTSRPVDMTLTPSTNVWVRALNSGTDTIILLVVNDNYYNDIAGCHYTQVSNATVTATLPSWMQSSPTAFEVTPAGIRSVSTQVNGNQLQVNLGTLNLTRLIVLTKDVQLLPTIQQRYDGQVRPGICAFAPEFCTNTPLSIAQQPSNQTVVSGRNACFTVVAFGTGLGYQWQTNNVNLVNGPHYSGCTNATLMVFNAGNSDVTSYRCVVTSMTGNTNSSYATLTVTTPPTLGYARQGSELVFTWTTNATGYALEYATNLPPTNWIPATPAPVVVGGQYVVTNTMIPQSGMERYYRLKKP